MAVTAPGMTPASAAPARLGAAGALVFNAFVWGVSWWPFRTLHEAGVHPLWGTALIYLFALACLLAVRPGAWRALAQQPALWLLALAAGVTNAGFNWAVTVGDVVRVVVLFYLMPAWAVLLAWLVLGERPRRAALARLGMAFAGVLVVLLPASGPSGLAQALTLSDGLALLGGFSFAATNVMLRRLRGAPGAGRMFAMFGGGAALAAAGALGGVAAGTVGALPAPAWGWCGIAALLALTFLAGNYALQYGASRLPASTTAVVMLTEVVFASGSAVVLGATALEPRTWVGGALIVSAALMASLQPRDNSV